MNQTTKPTHAGQPFAQAWTPKDTRELHAHSLAAPDFGEQGSGEARDYRAEQCWREAYHELLERLGKAIGQHLLHLSRTQGLAQPPHCQHVDTRLMSDWRMAAAEEEMSDRRLGSLGGHFTSAIERKLAYVQRDGALSPEDLHGFIQDAIQKGDFQSFEMESGQCRTSGHMITPQVKEWALTLKRYDPQSRQFLSVGEGDITAPTLQCATIPVPSGKLLVADWFYHEQFKKVTDEALEGSPSINSSAGCEERTRRLAEKLGVASVFVGNSGPHIIANETGVLVGHVAEENESQSAGWVCTDLWWATMVDKQVLVDLFAQDMPPEKAMKEVDNLISSQASPITQVDVPPGTHYLYYFGDPELFEKTFDHEDMDRAGLEETQFVLSRRDLFPKPADRLRPR